METRAPFNPFEQEETADQRVRRVIKQNLSMFDEQTRPLIEAYAEGNEASFTPQQMKQFVEAREKWWKDRYDTNYGNKSARKTALEQEEQQLNRRLLDALKANDRRTLAELEKEYINRYPEQMEAVVLLFQFVPFLQLSEALDTPHSRINRKQAIAEMTQYQFILTDFIYQNSHDKAYLTNFWDLLNEIADSTGLRLHIAQRKRGILSQVATLRLFDALGEKHSLSHPDVDALDAIDMVSGDTAIQVKTGFNEGLIIPTDIIQNGTQIDEGERIRHYQAYHEEVDNFGVKAHAYEQRIGKPLKAYFVVIPKTEVDATTGEPSKKLVADMRRQLQTHERHRAA